MNALREVQKVFPSLIKKMPSDGTTGTVSQSIPGYKEMEEGLEKDKAGKHSEAMKFYEEAGVLGNKAAFINMGNLYMFGKGVEQDWEKGIEMYKKCGIISDDELGWIRKLSNEKYVCGKELNLKCLFLLL